MKLEIKSIQPLSIIFSAVPAVLFVIGLLGGLVGFVFFPNPDIAPQALSGKFLAVGVFSLAYMILFSGLLLIFAFGYTLLIRVIGMRGIRVEIEQIDQLEE
ncbi:MAG: hypothetical protein NTW04_03210 [Elusimicrobia bacterium]|nr:hypothetical protein [Elusimicrobiota bacterium]